MRAEVRREKREKARNLVWELGIAFVEDADRKRETGDYSDSDEIKQKVQKFLDKLGY